MDIFIFRHGQSKADLEDRHEGRADFELTELGQNQAQALGEWLKKQYKIEKVFSSTLKRASETTQIVSKAIGAEVELDETLMEWDNGLLAGLYREEAAKRFPKPPGGRKPHDTYAQTESMINFRARAETFWSKFFHKYDNDYPLKQIGICSHGGMINMLIRSFLKLPVNQEMNFVTSDTGLHYLKITDDKRIIMHLNRQDHLIEDRIDFCS